MNFATSKLSSQVIIITLPQKVGISKAKRLTGNDKFLINMLNEMVLAR